VQSPPPAPEVARGPVLIEAGCTFDANEIRGEPGSVYRVSCPAGCSTNPSPVWGSNPFRADSPICVASIHAGLTTDSGGEFTLIFQDGRPAYRGSKRNGVEARDSGPYRASFQLQR
jgi:hypothetical protein